MIINGNSSNNGLADAVAVPAPLSVGEGGQQFRLCVQGGLWVCLWVKSTGAKEYRDEWSDLGKESGCKNEWVVRVFEDGIGREKCTREVCFV